MNNSPEKSRSFRSKGFWILFAVLAAASAFGVAYYMHRMKCMERDKAILDDMISWRSGGTESPAKDALPPKPTVAQTPADAPKKKPLPNRDLAVVHIRDAETCLEAWKGLFQRADAGEGGVGFQGEWTHQKGEVRAALRMMEDFDLGVFTASDRAKSCLMSVQNALEAYERAVNAKTSDRQEHEAAFHVQRMKRASEMLDAAKTALENGKITDADAKQGGGSPKQNGPKIGEYAKVKAGGWVFTTEDAFPKWTKAHAANDEVALQALDKEDHAIRMEKESPPKFIAAVSDSGLAQIRTVTKSFELSDAWTLPEFLEPMGKGHVFKVGDRVKAKADAWKVPDLSLIVPYVEGIRSGDREKVREFGPKVETARQKVEEGKEGEVLELSKDGEYARLEWGWVRTSRFLPAAP